jgi:putative membrane protein
MNLTAILVKLLILSVSVFVVAQFHPKIKIKSFGTAIAVAIVLSIANMTLGYVLRWLALPLTILTLGLFNFVIFGFLLWLTDMFLDNFEIKSFDATVIAAIIISVLNFLLNWIVFKHIMVSG